MSSLPSSMFVDGFQVPSMFSEELFRAALEYRPRPDDLFLVSYPKCGSTWSQHVIALILRLGEPLDPDWHVLVHSPQIEMIGPDSIEKLRRPVCVKSHLPFDLMPWSDQAKYIYIARNPKDTCVSYYHHTKAIPGHCFNGTFDQYFELFLSGQVDFGDFFDNLLSWYAHRNDPNVLFLTYEEMKEHFEDTILKIASFIDHEKYAVPLKRDRLKLEYIVDFCRFDNLKPFINKQSSYFFSMSEENAVKSNFPDGLKKVFGKMVKGNTSEEQLSSPVMCRKGVTGDWKNYFSEDQNRRMDEKFANRTKDTDIPILWEKYM